MSALSDENLVQRKIKGDENLGFCFYQKKLNLLKPEKDLWILFMIISWICKSFVFSEGMPFVLKSTEAATGGVL